ncbi:MAG TPA: hypothetical protein PKH07_14740, partial [bacterium]|nr:hypothetical protein [bacterium]
HGARRGQWSHAIVPPSAQLPSLFQPTPNRFKHVERILTDARIDNNPLASEILDASTYSR